jgi:HEAT repeat protein
MPGRAPDKPIEDVIAGLRDPTYKVRRDAARDLVVPGYQDPRALEALMRALKDKTVTVRQRALLSLKKLNDPRCVESVVPLLAEKSCRMHRKVSDILTQFREAAIPVLVKTVENPGSKVRCRAVCMLGNLGARNAVGTILGALKDEDHQVQAQAIFALANLKDLSGVEPLIEILRGDDLICPRTPPMP